MSYCYRKVNKYYMYAPSYAITSNSKYISPLESVYCKNSIQIPNFQQETKLQNNVIVLEDKNKSCKKI